MPKIILRLSLASVLLITLQACSLSGTSTPTRAVATPTSQAGVPITGGGSLTPSSVQVRVSVPTNCRTGPGEAYEVVSGFFVGQVAEVVGRSSNKAYWVIRDPNQHGQLCWLAGNFATLTGNADALPAFTTPPTPFPTLAPTPLPMPLSTP